jgi:hypothetical protein
MREVLYAGSKAVRSRSCPLSSTSIENNIAWRYTSTSTYILLTCKGGAVPLLNHTSTCISYSELDLYYSKQLNKLKNYFLTCPHKNNPNPNSMNRSSEQNFTFESEMSDLLPVFEFLNSLYKNSSCTTSCQSYSILI